MHSIYTIRMIQERIDLLCKRENLLGRNIFIDMDGTIADLYNVKDWLTYIEEESHTYPFDVAKPLLPISFINKLIEHGANVYVLSMTPRKCTDKYGLQVAVAKRDWVTINYPILKDKVIIIKSFDNKNLKGDQSVVLTTAGYMPTVKEDSIIIDDCENFRDTFIGQSYDEYLIQTK